MSGLQSAAAQPVVEDESNGLDGLVAMLSPLFEERCYTRGGYLAREGEPADALFYIEEGEAEICFSRKQRADEDLVDDDVRNHTQYSCRREDSLLQFYCSW